MSRDLALPRSGTYHLLDTMIDAGYVTHYPDQRVYGLGLSAYELASGYMRQESVQRLARRPLADPADRSGHSAHLSVLHGREIVYVIEERARGGYGLSPMSGPGFPHTRRPRAAPCWQSCHRRRCGRCTRVQRTCLAVRCQARGHRSSCDER